MKAWILRVRCWVAGKKTYLFGGVLILVAAAGVATGHMGTFTAITVAGYGLSMCGIAAKSNRQQKELLLAFEALAAAGLAARAGGLPAAIAAAREAIPKIVAECEGEGDTQG